MTRPTPAEARHARDTLNSPVATDADQDAAALVMERHMIADAMARDAASVGWHPDPAPARIGWLGWALILGAALALAIVAGSAFGKAMVGAEIAIEIGPEGR